MKKRLLGIPIDYSDKEEILFTYKKSEKNPKPMEPSVFRQDQFGISNQTFVTAIKIDFSVKKTTYEYYSISDVISSLGGIGASVKIMIGGLSVFWIIKFVIDLAMILKRQAKHQKNLTFIEIFSNYAG